MAERLARLLATSRYATDLLQREPEGVKLLGEDLVPLPAEATHRRDGRCRRAPARPPRRPCAPSAGSAGASCSGSPSGDLLGADRRGRRRGCACPGSPTRPSRPRWQVAARAPVTGPGAGRAADPDRGDRDGPVRRLRAVLRQRRRRDVRPRAAARCRPARGHLLRDGRRPTSCGACSRCRARDPPLEVDADLRPEGRQGPLVRSLDSYAAYYAQVVEGLGVPGAAARRRGGRRRGGPGPVHRADRPAPLPGRRHQRGRHARGPADQGAGRPERLPRGADPHTHLKLGRGGLADVEWTVQLLQMRHADAVPGAADPGHPDGAGRRRGRRGCSTPEDAETLAWAGARSAGCATRSPWCGAGPPTSCHATRGSGPRSPSILGYPPGESDADGQRLPAGHPARARRRGAGVLGVSGARKRGEVTLSGGCGGSGIPAGWACPD